MSPPSATTTINFKSPSESQDGDIGTGTSTSTSDNNDDNNDDKDGEIGYEYLAAKARATQAQAANGIPEHIRVKNRRKRYLELHTEYFFGGEGELNGRFHKCLFAVTSSFAF